MLRRRTRRLAMKAAEIRREGLSHDFVVRPAIADGEFPLLDVCELGMRIAMQRHGQQCGALAYIGWRRPWS